LSGPRQFRFSSLRYKCAKCERLFRPARRDTEYCSPACQKAASRERAKAAQLRADAEAAFKIAQNSHLYRQRVERNRDGAIILSGFPGVRAIATERGHLITGPLEALESLYGTDWIKSCKARFILPEELPGLLHVYPSAPFRYREVERDFLRILSGEELPLILLEDDTSYHAEVLESLPPNPPVPWFERPGIPSDEDVPFGTPGPHFRMFETLFERGKLEWEEMVEQAKLSLVDEGWFKPDDD
jgi:hypothetical protein